MSKPKYVVRPELKKQILERVKQGDKPVAEIAEEHGLAPQAIYGWLRKGATASPSTLELARLRKENQTLLGLIGKMTLELSVAKKKTDVP